MVAIGRFAAALAFAALSATRARGGGAHPLHTTLAELHVDTPHHIVRARIRLFADDLAKALPRRGTRDTIESRAAAYVVSAFSLSSAGHPVALRSCGIRRDGDLIWVCLESDTPADARHLRARDALLVEAFADQVNIVQIGDGRGRKSVVFLKGDGDKSLDD